MTGLLPGVVIHFAKKWEVCKHVYTSVCVSVCGMVYADVTIALR